MSEGQRQWWAISGTCTCLHIYIFADTRIIAKRSATSRWGFKSQHFDSVLLFKMGKFYEMFEMDAHVGAEVLGLTYMKVPFLCHHLTSSYDSPPLLFDSAIPK